MIKLAKQGTTAELYIYGIIGDEWGGITPGEVVAELDKARGAETLTVRINSEGGKVSDGIAIMNRLAAFPAPVHVEIDGLAASAASAIAMAGDRITMGTGSFLMIHEPWVRTGGTAGDLRKTADVLDLVNEEAAAIYSQRSGIDTGKVKQMMADETWMNSEDAIAMNFADDAVEREAVAAKWDLSHFAKTPDCIVARCQAESVRLPKPSPILGQPITTFTGQVDDATPQRDYRATKIGMRRRMRIS